jgi:hypothetical protein
VPARAERNQIRRNGVVERQNKVELDRALELAVISSWADLVNPGESCLVHVEYKDISDIPLDSLEVWTIRNRGYGTLVCLCSISPSSSTLVSSAIPSVQFANSCHSQTLASNLSFIMRNQGEFTRPTGRSVHGLVQIDSPSDEEQSAAAAWSEAVRTEFTETVWN